MDDMLMQDINRGLSIWLATRLGARLLIKRKDGP